MKQFFTSYIIGIASSLTVAYIMLQCDSLLNQIGIVSGLTVAYFMINHSKFTFKIKSLKELKESERFMKRANLFSEFIQFGLLISITCFFFLQIGLIMLDGTSGILNGVPLDYVFKSMGISIVFTLVSSFFFLRLIYLGENNIFKKYFKIS